MANVKFFKNENVIGGDNTKGEKIGGISKSKLIKVYLELRSRYADVINFRSLGFMNFVDFVIGNDYSEEDVKMSNLAYELRTNSVYGLE